MVRVGMTAAGEGIQVMCCMALAAVIDIAEPVLRTVCTGQPPEIVIEGTVLHHHHDDMIDPGLLGGRQCAGVWCCRDAARTGGTEAERPRNRGSSAGDELASIQLHGCHLNRCAATFCLTPQRRLARS